MMGPQPRLSIGSGYVDTIQILDNKKGILHFKSVSKAVAVFGLGAQTVSRIKIDPEIAIPFFSTPNYKEYIGGQVDRNGSIGVSINITMQKLLTKNVGVIAGRDRAYYNESTETFNVLSPVYPIAMSDLWQNIDMTIDLGRWSKDTGILIERKSYYNVDLATSQGGTALSFSPSPSRSYLYDDVTELNSWIENPVDPTTITSENDRVFGGITKQNMENRHPADCTIRLSANNKIIAQNIPIDASGDWRYNSIQKFISGTVIKAQVVAKEKAVHENGYLDTNLSTPSYYTIGQDGTLWEQWQVKPPTISTAYDEETNITGSVPDQNRQYSRTYQLVIVLNGEIIYRGLDPEPGVYGAPVFGKNLATGDVIEAYIIGYEPGEAAKQSKTVKTIVLENKEGQENWANWIVDPPILDDADHGDDVITGSVPPQNKFNDRNYDVVVSVNGVKVGTERFTFNGGEFIIPLTNVLVEQDVITAKIVGHEAGQADKTSTTVTKVVSDSSNWEGWSVNAPLINEAYAGDGNITVDIGNQNIEFDREYQLKVSVNGVVVSNIIPAKVNGRHNIAVGFPLKGGDVIRAQIIGSQAHRPDKESSVTELIVGEKKQNVQVQFVDEEGTPLSDPVVLRGDAGTTIDLTKEATIQVVISSLVGKHFELVKAPNNESAISIDKEEKTVQYQFKGTLFVDSFPKTLNFGDKYLTKSFIKGEQPKYDVPLIIGDTRKKKTSWTLTATLAKPLTSQDSPSEVLPRALYYKQNDTTKVALKEGESQPIEVGTMSGTGIYNVSENWDSNKQGLQLNVFSNEVIQKGQYKAAILWQVSETP
ncbi:hypothetical protein RV06_GL001623 [Enterococcus haemoperoxidus]|nr:hypothetical protein RV06_GL001623 [Enterococcus haemoperoxidus]